MTMTNREIVPLNFARDLALAPRDQTRGNLLVALEALDLHGTMEDAPVDETLTRALWANADRWRTLSAIDQAYLVWRLCQKVTAVVWEDDAPVEKEVERWMTWDPLLYRQIEEKGANAVWETFCLRHLGMDPNTAYQRRRTWEVYHETMGYTREMMERAGISKLNRARAQVVRDWQNGGTDEELTELVFGVTYEEAGEEPPPSPDDAPLTPDDYLVPPATDDAVQRYISSRRTTDGDEGKRAMGRMVYFFSVNGDTDTHQRTVTLWARGPADEVAEPVPFAELRMMPRPINLTPGEWAEACRAFVEALR